MQQKLTGVHTPLTPVRCMCCREDIFKEIDILCGLNHENVLFLKEYFEEDNKVGVRCAAWQRAAVNDARWSASHSIASPLLTDALRHKPMRCVTNLQVYLITEILTGGELLDAVLQRGSYNENEARSCFVQLLRGIEYLHSKWVMLLACMQRASAETPN